MTPPASATGAASDGARDTTVLEDGRRIQGFVDDGYGVVFDTFVANFVDRYDLGAGCAVYVNGRPAVDVWGGIADARVARPWTHDTAAVIFSCSKGVLAVCAYLLVQEGRLDLDAPVGQYWPEFSTAEKATLTVREAMSHRAGLPALDVDLSRADVLAWDPVIEAIEIQRPLHRPAAGHIYHTMTYGWLLGEVIKTITGHSPGEYFRQAIGNRLGLRTWIGLPDEMRPFVAWMEPPLPDEDSHGAREAARLGLQNRVVARSASMGGAFGFPVENGVVSFNATDIQAAEVPAANGISTAESLARLYAACVSNVEGALLLSDVSRADLLRVQSAGPQLSGMPDDGARWGTGFQLASPPSQPMLGGTSFGHAGAGGQLGFADVDHRVGFAYIGNQMGGYGDARARELTMALRVAIGA
jgi:CubicO group peptidase (beta-lactamase class C family)